MKRTKKRHREWPATSSATVPKTHPSVTARRGRQCRKPARKMRMKITKRGGVIGGAEWLSQSTYRTKTWFCIFSGDYGHPGSGVGGNSPREPIGCSKHFSQSTTQKQARKVTGEPIKGWRSSSKITSSLMPCKVLGKSPRPREASFISRRIRYRKNSFSDKGSLSIIGEQLE